MSESPNAAQPLSIITPPASTTTKGELTKYIVLERQENASWDVVGNYGAHNSEAAIKAHVAKSDDPGGTYVAIAQRHWKPVSPAVEVVTTKMITLKAAT